MPSLYVRELSTGEIVRNSLEIYKSNFILLFLAYVVPTLPGIALFAWGQANNSWPLMIPGFLVELLGAYIAYTAVTVIVSDACVGNTPSLREAFTRAQSRTGPLLVVSILQGLLIFAGTLALIVPAIAFFIWFAFAPIVVILEGRNAKSALSRSKYLTKGFFWRNLSVLLLMIVIFLAVFFIDMIVIAISTAVMTAMHVSTPIAAVASTLLSVLAFELFYPLFFVSFVLCYYDLRARKEHYDTLALAAELGR